MSTRLRPASSAGQLVQCSSCGGSMARSFAAAARTAAPSTGRRSKWETNVESVASNFRKYALPSSSAKPETMDFALSHASVSARAVSAAPLQRPSRTASSSIVHSSIVVVPPSLRRGARAHVLGSGNESSMHYATLQPGHGGTVFRAGASFIAAVPSAVGQTGNIGSGFRPVFGGWTESQRRPRGTRHPASCGYRRNVGMGGNALVASRTHRVPPAR